MNAFPQQFIAALDGNAVGLKALADAIVADPKARAAVEASLFTAGGTTADPIGEIETQILNDPVASKALASRLFKDGDFLSKALDTGDATVKQTIPATVAAKATKDVVTQLLADANSAAFLAAIASADGPSVKKFIDGLRDNTTTGPVVIDEIIASIANDTLSPADGAKLQKDPPMTELIAVLGADSSRDAFVNALLAPGKVHDALVTNLTATPDALVASLLRDKPAQLLDKLLSIETVGAARDQLFARIAVPPKLQTLAAAAIRDGAKAATAAGTPTDGQTFLHSAVEVFGTSSDEFLDDLAASFHSLNGQASVSRFLAAFLGTANAPADFAKSLTDHAAAKDKLVAVVAAVVAAFPDMKPSIKALVS